MLIRRLTAAFAAAAALGSFTTPALAETREDMSFDGMTAMARVDRDRDGMVSKKEFLAAMSGVWDMKMREMNVKGDRLNAEYYRQVLMYLRAGG